MSGDAATEEPTPAGFAVEVPGFAGPFRLLADLILEQKVDVCDVPIATGKTWVSDSHVAPTIHAGFGAENVTDDTPAACV